MSVRRGVGRTMARDRGMGVTGAAGEGVLDIFT